MFLMHLNIVELLACDLHIKNEFYWLIHRAQGWDLGIIFDRLKNRSCSWRKQSTEGYSHGDLPYSAQNQGLNNAQHIGEALVEADFLRKKNHKVY